MKDRIEKLREAVVRQCAHGTFNYSREQYEKANTLIMAMAIIDGVEPEFLPVPKKWGCEFSSALEDVTQGFAKMMRSIKHIFKQHADLERYPGLNPEGMRVDEIVIAALRELKNSDECLDKNLARKGKLFEAKQELCEDGTWDQTKYMHGQANGMILAMAFMDGIEEPEFLAPPEDYLFDSDDKERFERFERLKKTKDMACREGNWNHSHYMHGVAQGLILAVSVMSDSEPVYIEPLEEYLDETGMEKPVVSVLVEKNIAESGE